MTDSQTQNKFRIYNRYDAIEQNFEEKDNNVYQLITNASYVRISHDDNGDVFGVDPEGGPMIVKDSFLSDYSTEAPHLWIDKIMIQGKGDIFIYTKTI